jgi:flagellar motor switch protein FliG
MLVTDTDEYVKAVLRKALGEDKANLLIDRILQGSDTTGIESLKWMDPGSVAELLRNEHPQIVAAILVHLEFDQAAEVLKSFSERHRNEVMVRIATLDGIQPSALKDLNDVMSKVLAGGDRMKKSNLGGVKTAAEILNMMGTVVETSVLDFVREADGELAQKIMDNMFTFDDLEKIDDKGFQSLLKEVQSDSLVLALKAASPELRDKVFRNMSSARGRIAEGRPGIARPGQAVRGRGRAEGNAEDRAPPGRRRPDRAGRWRGRTVRMTVTPAEAPAAPWRPGRARSAAPAGGSRWPLMVCEMEC